MAKTEKGNNTKEKIIGVAKELFYEQGYEGTTVAQITDMAEVNNGLFTYYFGSKIALSSMIFTEFMLDLRNIVSKKMYEQFREYDFALGIAVERRIYNNLLEKYPKLRQFSIENYAENSSPRNKDYSNHNQVINNKNKMKNSKRNHFYQLQRRLINPDISDIDLNIYQVAGIAVTNSLMAAYHEGILDCSSDYLSSKSIEIVFHLLGLEKNKIDELISKSKIVSDQLDIELIDYFILE